VVSDTYIGGIQMYEQGNSFAEGYMIGRDSTPNYGYNSGFGGFGNDGAWWILILLLAGWGNNGFGGGFGGGNNGNLAFDLGRLATTNDVASGFNNSAVLSSLNDLKLGQAGLQQTLCQGFNGINTSILTSTNDLSRQFADCCCTTQRAIDAVNYNLAKSTCDIVNSQNANTQRIIDMYTGDKIATLTADKAALTAQLSQNAQTRTLIDTLRPVAQPAYLTCSPYESVYSCAPRGCAVVQ
jgi:hypothetical protein